jgi:hypothetical protein
VFTEFCEKLSEAWGERGALDERRSYALDAVSNFTDHAGDFAALAAADEGGSDGELELGLAGGVAYAGEILDEADVPDADQQRARLNVVASCCAGLQSSMSAADAAGARARAREWGAGRAPLCRAPELPRQSLCYECHNVTDARTRTHQHACAQLLS